MEESFDLVIENVVVIAPRPGRNNYVAEDGRIGIKGGKIQTLHAAVGAKTAKTMNAKGLTAIPGAIDTQVHFRDPGFPEKEDLKSGTRSAIYGGVTSIFDMPNTEPPTLTAIDIADKMTRAKNGAWSNYGFYLGVSPSNLDRLAELENHPGICGLKMFLGSSTGNLVVGGWENAKKALMVGKRRCAIHSEDNDRLTERKKIALDDPGNVLNHPIWRDEESAYLSTTKIVGIAKELKRRVHILHVSSKREIEFLAGEKARRTETAGLITCEVTPQHLTLSAPECYERLGTFAQMNPPIRTAEHRDALWIGVEKGIFDVIGSDHAPHTRAEKAQTYPESPSGMTGVQTLLPIMLNHAANGKLSLFDVVDMTSRKPAEVFGIKNKGVLAEGYDADIALVDLGRMEKIENSWIQSKCGWTPFDGMKVQGWVIATILGGEIVFRDGQMIGSPRGRVLEFQI